MSFFEYISVIVSVILALGIARVLGGLGDLLVARREKKTYWVHSVWIAFVFLMHIRIWWSYWDVAAAPSTNLFAFLYMLIGPAAAYLSAYVLLPGGYPNDADRHFYATRKPFFALGIVLAVYAALTPLILGYASPAGLYAGAAFGTAINVVGLCTENRRVHSVIAIVSLVGFSLLLLSRLTAVQIG